MAAWELLHGVTVGVVSVLGLEPGLPCATIGQHFGPGVVWLYGGIASVPVLEPGLICTTICQHNGPGVVSKAG